MIDKEPFDLPPSEPTRRPKHRRRVHRDREPEGKGFSAGAIVVGGLIGMSLGGLLGWGVPLLPGIQRNGFNPMVAFSAIALGLGCMGAILGTVAGSLVGLAFAAGRRA
jgi:hypothetical protein